jgi:hypothetical protein
MRPVAALAVLLLPLAAAAPAQEVPEVSREPLARMQQLSMLAGKWRMTVFVTEDGGETWQATPPQDVELEFVHKGMMLEEVPGDLDSPGFHMRTYITYDQYRNVYRKAALDDVWGILDLYQGRIEGDRLVVDNLEAGTFFPLGDDRWRGFRLTIELKPDRRWMWIDKTDDDGRTWQPAFKSEYVKIGA